MMVDLPEPLSPTNAIYSPLSILIDIPLRVIVVDVGYLNTTFLNSTAPEIE
jgi:hypothetical protein